MQLITSLKAPGMVLVYTKKRKMYKYINSGKDHSWWPDTECILKSLFNNFDNIAYVRFRYPWCHECHELNVNDYIKKIKATYVEKVIGPLLAFQAGGGIDGNIRNMINVHMTNEFVKEQLTFIQV
jgi:hypothetical protein